jgi:non-ribosomal peptide synthetase component F
VRLTVSDSDLLVGGSKRVCLLDDEASVVENTFRSSGDIVRRDGNSRLIFVGREDNQIKRQGKRINLGDIEKVRSKVIVSLNYMENIRSLLVGE